MATSRSSDTPSPAGADDRLEPESSRQEPSAATDPGTEGLVGRTLQTLMNPSGEEPEETYQQHLEELREDGERIAAAVRDKYQALDEEEYQDRWGLVQLLADVRHPSSVSALTEVLRQPIPPERSPDPAHGISTVGEEVIIRTTAVEALARLAADGVTAAKEQLLEQIQNENFSIRRAAVQGITESGDADLVRRAREGLENTGNERLLEIRRADVGSVPQAEGGRFLKPGPVPPAPPDPSTS